MISAVALAMVAATGGDPISAFLTRDWAALGGWGLLISTWIAILWGALREWWVPGPRHRRLEEASIKMTDANAQLTTQNGQLITSNEIVKHFFEETVPKRGETKA